MKNGLLLTLKELIKLGVIKIKKRRRRRGFSTTKKLIQEQQPSVEQGVGEQKYNAFVTTTAPNPQAYSDALRLRDENRNFDTRLLEYKNQQQEQKLLLEDQQQLQQQLQQSITQGIPIINNLLTRTKAIESGFANDDNVDVTEVFGSDNFKTQQDIADPELRQMPPPPQMQLPPSAPSVKKMIQRYENITKSPAPESFGESEYEDIPEPKRRNITKKIKSRVEEYLRLYPNMTEEKAKELVLMETKSVPKQKRRPKKIFTGVIESTEEFI